MKNKTKKIITELSKRNTFLRKILRKILFLKRRANYKKYYRKNVVQDNLLIFEAYMGRAYACSPKAIYEEMIKDKKYKNYEFVWAFKEPQAYLQKSILKNAKIISYGSQEYYNYYSKAKYWITNSRIPEEIIKKSEQVYVQTWHGTPLKRLGHDIVAETKNALNTKAEMIEKYNQDAVRYDYMVSPSVFTSNKYHSAFNLKKTNPNCQIIEEGYPRNDFLYNYTKRDVARVKKELGIDSKKKVILYAPTWRDDQHQSGVGYTYKTEVDFDYLQKNLQDEYVILFRAHYFVANKFDFDKYKNFIYDVSDVDDINDLYIISDILVTDYSSVFFDYANLERPMIFFMYDLEYYDKKLRGFYIDLKELPGDIVNQEKEIVKIINNLEEYNKKQKTKYIKFNEKYNYLEDGKASKRVIKKICEGELKYE